MKKPDLMQKNHIYAKTKTKDEVIGERKEREEI